LSYFTHLKSLIISSRYGFPGDELKQIFESDLFQNLNSFKIKSNRLHSWSVFGGESIIEKDLLRNVFNHKNSLEIFEYPVEISPSHLYKNNFEMNFNLRSLTLILFRLINISEVIHFTPNLEYLNITSYLPRTSDRMINEINIKLKEFHFTGNRQSTYDRNFDMLFSYIQQFSLSLICLSLNLVHLLIENTDEIPFNSLKLQHFLESMIKLQQFHCYAKLYDNPIDSNIMLSQFKDQYWFDHNWFFGMHGKYLYTLPFHFDHLCDFYHSFDGVKSSNHNLLETNPRIWYNVKSIDLLMTLEYDFNLIKQLKMKMPKLTVIFFVDNYSSRQNEPKNIFMNKNEGEKSNVTLNNVTTIECKIGPGENKKEWLIHVLPNLIHLLLSDDVLPSIHSELTDVLNKKIQRLDINTYKLSPKRISIYFSNVQDIFCDLRDLQYDVESHKYTAMEILANFKNLKTLLVRYNDSRLLEIGPLIRDASKDNASVDVNEIMETYYMKHFSNQYCLFTKKLL
jgi:hypothetical protein